MYLFCYVGKNLHNNYLMGLIFSTSWRVAPKKIKILMGIWNNKKKTFQKYPISGNSLEPKFEIFFKGFPAKFGGFRKNWDFHIFRLASFLKGFPSKFRGFRKIRDFYTFGLAWFLKGFTAKKRLVLHVLCPSHPCASLARTVLKPLSFAQTIHALVLHVLSLSLPTLSTSYPAGRR